MLQLINELLSITESQQFDVEALFEDLGNLKQLQLGKLEGALKQAYNQNVSYHRDASYGGTDEVKSKINTNKWNQGLQVGHDSEIKDVPRITDFADVRKVFKSHPGMQVMSLHTPGVSNAIAVLIDQNQGDITKPSSFMGFGWDLTKTTLSPEVIAKLTSTLKTMVDDYREHRVTAKAGTSLSTGASKSQMAGYEKEEYLTKQGKPTKKSMKKDYAEYEDWSDDIRSSFTGKWAAKLDKSADKVTATSGDEEVGVWDKKAGKGWISLGSKATYNTEINQIYGKSKNYSALTVNVALVRDFINVLAKELKLSGKAAMPDLKAREKRGARQANPPVNKKTAAEFKNDLNVRLAKFKNAKLVTVADGKEFLDKILAGTFKKLNYGGKTYFTNPTTYSSDEKGLINKLIKGGKFDIRFETDNTASGYGSLLLTLEMKSGQLSFVDVKAS